MSAAALDRSFTMPPDLLGYLHGWRNRLLIVGVAALALCVAGGFFNADQFYRSYLWSYMFFIGVPLGATALLMLQYLTGGAWGMVIRRPCEAASRTLPLLLLLFIPIVIGIPRLYEWSHAEIVAHDAILRHKSVYLNVPFFLIRTAAYFAGWILIGHLLYKWSGDQDRGDTRAAGRLAAISGPGLIFYGFTVTFMAIDWVLSINPHWFSTIFGLLFVAGEGLSALACLICLLVLLSSRPPMSQVLTARHLHDVGKLLLAFVMVWAYFSFSQLLIIWSGNLPEEITWYRNRFAGGWQFMGLSLVFLHFAFPFALLLSRDLKRDFRLLRAVAVLIIVMRFVDLYWMVAPDFHKMHFTLNWMDILMPVGLGGIWLAAFLWQLAARPLMPLQDPHLEEALAHGRE
ncbi:MAG TPA: hypothetical protein VMI94_28770 [Bryobacteraceae bacterium]|nr:hypothetical protein [Bryobacteraceae bacterium]